MVQVSKELIQVGSGCRRCSVHTAHKDFFVIEVNFNGEAFKKFFLESREMFNNFPCYSLFNVKANATTSEFGTLFEYKVKVGDINEVRVLNVPGFLKGNEGYVCSRGFNFGKEGFKVGMFTG